MQWKHGFHAAGNADTATEGGGKVPGKDSESMEFDLIRYFPSLAATLYFTEAAMRSGVSQPTLTSAFQSIAGTGTAATLRQLPL